MPIPGLPATAEDAAQDVFVWIWENRDRWTPRSGIRAYLLRAAANRARDANAARATHHRLERTYLFADGEAVAEELAVGEDPDTALWRAVGDLPERWREGVMLRYVEGLPFADVGAVLGVSADAAKKLVRRALLALRRALYPDP